MMVICPQWKRRVNIFFIVDKVDLTLKRWFIGWIILWEPSRTISVFLSLRPSVLDNFGLLSGQLNTINKMLKNEKTPSFRSQVIIPLLLSQKPDDDLTVSFTSLSFVFHRNSAFYLFYYIFFCRSSQSSVSRCSAMRLFQTTCEPNLIQRWRSRKSSWAQRRHASVLMWHRSVRCCVNISWLVFIHIKNI